MVWSLKRFELDPLEVVTTVQVPLLVVTVLGLLVLIEDMSTGVARVELELQLLEGELPVHAAVTRLMKLLGCS